MHKVTTLQNDAKKLNRESSYIYIFNLIFLGGREGG